MEEVDSQELGSPFPASGDSVTNRQIPAEQATEILRVTRLRLVDFRNIGSLDIEPARRFNVISGDNGHGKTSLLEALYFVATSRSFRSDRLDRLKRQGQPFLRVDAEVEEGQEQRTQRATLSAKGRMVTVDGQTPERLTDYAIRTPIIVFHPGDLSLSMGAASPRRDLLDRVALFADPSLSVERSRYRQAVRERQKILETRGESAPDLPAYEALIAQHGSRLTLARHLAADAVAAEALPGFARLVASQVPLTLQYQPGGTADEVQYRKELEERRATDGRRHMTTFGPHRDDLQLNLDGRLARHHASQGQHRILTLTLKLAELAAIRKARAAHPILLLDDVSSELDPKRIGAVYEFLSSTHSQVFVTTTRPELFRTPAAGPEERRDFRLVDGALEEVT